MNSYRPSGGFAPYGLLSDDSYNEEDPRFALSYGGGGATGETPQSADALGRLAYGFTGPGGMQMLLAYLVDRHYLRM
jgi:hypothetical protein